MGLGFTQDVRQEYVDRGQFIDVGIAEENMVAMSSGIAKMEEPPYLEPMPHSFKEPMTSFHTIYV